MKLKGKVAVVTGAGRGIGRAIAVEMAREGASVAILSRTTAELRETEKNIRSMGAEVVRLAADVSKRSDVEKMATKTMSALGRIDILVNNAAIIGAVKPLHAVSEREWDAAIDINLKGVYLSARAVIPWMIKRGSGKIINLTSGLGEMVMSPFGLYSIGKAGVLHLTRIMAEELRQHNIQVNGLDPGVTDTRMHEEIRAMGPEVLGEDVYREFLELKQSGSLKPPERIARLAVFLASEESDAISGANGTETFYRRLGYSG